MVTITDTFTEPWFQGRSIGSLVPGKYHAALNGRPYMLDLQSDQFRQSSVPILRQQADAGPSPSETSLNPEGLWRRSADTWHKGAGQTFFDRVDSDPARYSTSKGVNPWDKWTLSLLNDVTHRRTTSNPNPLCLVAGGYLYYTAGTAMQWTLAHRTESSPTWNTVTDGQLGAILSVCTDGQYVYATDGITIHRTVIGSSTGISWNLLSADIVAFVKGRFMAARGATLYNVLDSTVPDALEVAATIPGNWRWVGFAEGDVALYVAGYAGDKSRIFRSSVKDDGSGLDVFLPAASLPDGELVRSIVGYLGFVLIGTDLGVRFASADADGNLTLGSLIPTDGAVRCFEPQDRFVWFGWPNFDDTSTGLGRVDLSTFIDINTPAYASDLLAGTQGEVVSCATYQQGRVFTVAGSGLWTEDVDSAVDSGTLETGRITYRLPDPKVAMYVDVHTDLEGTVAVAVAADGGDFRTVGSVSSDNDPVPVGHTRGQDFDVQLTLSDEPTVTSVTLRAYPAASTIDLIEAPLLLHGRLTLADNSQGVCDVEAELAELRALRDSRSAVAWQMGGTSTPVIVQDYVWTPHHYSTEETTWNGVALVQMKVVA